MATITSAATGAWSATATWVGGSVPVDDDAVVIASGHTVTFDVDTSGFAAGIAGITVTGTLKLSRDAGTYHLKMKAATTIAGAGTFDCGTSGDPIVFAAKHTITGGAAWFIQGSGGLTMTVYGAEPTYTTIKLSADEAIGQTELSVDTDVTADIWAAADTIRVDDINKAVESEERTIDAGGIAAGTITITAGLTAAKSTGAVVSLITRNVKFTGVGAAGYVAQNFATGKLTVDSGQWATANYRVFNSCADMVISGGAFSGNNYVLNGGAGASISGGAFSGNNYVISSCTGASVSGGTFTGSTIVINSCPGASVSGGTFSGNTYALLTCTGASVSGGTFSGNNYVISSCAGVSISGGTFSGNNAGINSSSADIKGATFSSNTHDIRDSVFSAYGITLTSATPNYLYANFAKEIYSYIADNGGVAGAYKSWTKGGVTETQAAVYPTGYTTSYQTVLENASHEGFWQKEITVNAGESVNFTLNLRKDATMTYLPRIQIFNKASTDPFAGGTPDHTFTMTDSVDTWEDESYTYTNSTSGTVTLVIRAQGKNASGNLFAMYDAEVINVDLTTALANIAIIDALVDAIKVKTDQFVFTVANQVDANALTGGLTASEVRIEMDSNSTQLAAIVEDTATTIPATLTTIDGIVDDILVDTGTTLPAQLNTIRGADSDTLETLSDQMDALASGSSIATINTSIIGLQSYIASNLDDDIVEGTIIKTRGDTWNIPISNIGSLVGNKNIWFTMKLMTALQDEQCTLQVAKTEGLLILNGASGSIVASSGSIIILDETVGNIMIKVTPNITKQIMSSNQYSYDAQTLDANDDVLTVEKGSFEVTADTTRRIV